MASETQVIGPDPYGNERYKALYEEILADIGKLAAIDRSLIMLEPEIPFFAVSVRMKARPSAKKIGDVASTRMERDIVYVSISDEMYAPGTLTALWNVYGRDNVQQTDRLDITVVGAKRSADVDAIEVESTSHPVQDILGAIWRVLPEGIRNRRTFTTDDVITAIATEEIMRPEHIEKGKALHESMVNGGVLNV